MPANADDSLAQAAENSLPADLDERSTQAKMWMKRGIALLSVNDPNALPEALHCFDEALALRRTLPVEQSVWFRWLLTACWMNRGDVLTRLGGRDQLTEAVRSFDEAIVHLVRLPLDEDPQYRGRLVLAWMNRSLALRAQANAESLREAASSLAKARQALDGGVRPDRPVNRMLQVTLMVNRAALLLELAPPDAGEAMQEATKALELCRDFETKEQLAAEIGLKARHVYCHAVAMLLETPPVDSTHADDWILRATDLVDEAMRLTAQWEPRGGVPHFLKLRHELFCFGCRMYLAWQPHFMAEFLLDVLDPKKGAARLNVAEDLRQAALEALTLASEVLKQRGPLDFGLQKVDRLLEVLESLNQASLTIKKLPIP